MPYKSWSHRCPHSDSRIGLGVPVCPRCGQNGVYDGWVYHVVEQYGVSQQRYGFKPIGDHKPMVARLLAPLLARCATCEGRGLLNGPDDDSYVTCADCSGTGSRLAVSPEIFEQAAAQIEAAYPGSQLQRSVLLP